MANERNSIDVSKNPQKHAQRPVRAMHKPDVDNV